MCCNWDFSFWISVYGKLLVCVMYCIMVHSFCCLLGVSECIVVMLYLNVAILCSVGWFEQKLMVVSVINFNLSWFSN